MQALSLLTSMPKPAKIAIPLCVVLGIAWLLYHSTHNVSLVMYFLIGCLVVGLVFGLFLLMLKAKAKKQSAAFSRNMGAAGAATPTGVSSAEAMAKLDDMRRKFDEGVQKFASAGKDLHGMPWYMVVGEPGSGKTEAIRRSSIGFPPGLQDEFQGVGGTINMNWWFTNQAVVLDLAGRLVFEDLKPGATNEWREFLNMLVKGRPNAPVNGMLLVIPADSLIKDSEEQIKKKAQKLAEQFELVQRTLDVRFPVFVLVTKCDLVNGFREFFEDLTTPAEQHQMLGWSNPQDIDEPLNLGQIAEHMRSVIARLLDRRMSVLGNPEPMKDLSERRIDEVDSLYAFPHSFRRLLPAMRHYLETIFVAGEWSTRPLFLRGIYFTSSMREGAVLDDELGKALGVDPAALPEGRLWDRDRAFFLRDVFLKKIFPEQGLVTRASNVRQQTQRRRRSLLITSTVGVSALILLTWLGGNSLEKSVGAEKKVWAQVALAADLKDYAPVPEAKKPELEARYAPWAQLVARGGEGTWEYRGDRRVPDLKPILKLATLHKKLAVITAKDLQIPFAFRIFRPFDRSLEKDRRAARRVFFELGVVRPLVLGAKDVLAATKPAEWTEDHTQALRMILRLEAEAAGESYSPGDLDSELLDLAPLVAVVAGPDALDVFEPVGQNLQEYLEWSYDAKGGRGEWPPAWAVLGDDLRANAPLKGALDAFVQYCATPESLANLVAQIGKVGELGGELKKFRDGPQTRHMAAYKTYLEFFTGSLESWMALQNLLDSKPVWTEQYVKYNTSYGAFAGDYGVLTNAFAKIPFIQQPDLDAAYTGTVTKAMEEAQKRFTALALPGAKLSSLRSSALAKLSEAKDKAETQAEAKAGGKKKDKEQVDEADAENLFDRITALMAAALEKMRGEYLNPRVVDGLKDFKSAWQETAAQVATQGKLIDHLAPVPMGDALLAGPQTWTETLKRMGSGQVPLVNKALGDMTDALQTRCAAILAAEKSLSERDRELLMSMQRKAEKASSYAKVDRTFAAGLTERMDRWRQLSGNAIQDRDVLLALSADAFTQQYMFIAFKGLDEDYTSEYWREAGIQVLRALGNDVLKHVQQYLPQLRQYAVFPLDQYKDGGSELAVTELYNAASLFQKVRPCPTPLEKKTLADGVITAPPALFEQIQRLRTLGLERSMGWLGPAMEVLDALPPDDKTAKVCTVWLLPETVQQELLTSSNKGQVSDDGIRFIWPYLALATGEQGQSARRYDTFAAKPTVIGKVKFPGPSMELKFFKHKDEADNLGRTITSTGFWSPMQWLFRYAGERGKTDPRKWRVKVSLKDENGHDRLLWLELEFENALPEARNWPDQRKL